jgi:hypothetical protein
VGVFPVRESVCLACSQRNGDTVRQKIIMAAAVCLGGLLCRSLVAGGVALDVTVNRDQMYLGESINLSVKVSGAGSSSEPDLSAIKNCSKKSLGRNSFSSFNMINGRVTRESANIFDYEITPNVAGRFVAGPVSVKVDGNTISHEGRVVEVSGLESQTDVMVRISSSREAALVDEMFEVTLSVAMKRLSGQYADAHPLDPNEPPSLSVPFLDMQPIRGLDIPDIKGALEKYLTQQNKGPGFAINSYTIQNSSFPFGPGFPFDAGMGAQPAKFLFERSAMQTNNGSYLNYSIRLKYTAREEGTYTFGPAVFKGKIVTDVDPQGRGITKPIFAVGPACVVRVVPPPEQGRPASYIGAIGTNLTVESSLDTQTCNVGDPLKLTLSISGNVGMDNICPPLLSAQTNLTRNFKMYDDTVQLNKKDGVREYSYTVRPIRDGTIEFPPVEVSYFDSAERAYKTARSKPIPVRANKTATVGSEIIIATATNRATEQKINVSDMFVPAPLDVNPSGAEKQSMIGGSFSAAPLAAGPIIYLITLSIVHGMRRFRRNAGARRHRGALARALAILRRAGKSDSLGSGEAGRWICSSIRAFLADRFDVSENAITPADARRLLSQAGIDAALVDALCNIMERSFNADYRSQSSSAGNAGQDCEAAARLLAQVDGVCREHDKPE